MGKTSAMTPLESEELLKQLKKQGKKS